MIRLVDRKGGQGEVFQSVSVQPVGELLGPIENVLTFQDSPLPFAFFEPIEIAAAKNGINQRVVLAVGGLCDAVRF